MDSGETTSSLCWNSCPDNVLLHVFRYFDARELTQAANVSMQWNRVANDDLLWKRLCGVFVKC